MKIRLYLGGIEFELDSERDLIINPEFCKFQKDCPGAPKVSIKISWDWEHATLPESEMVGADLLHRYYQEDNKCFCTALGGYKGLIASTCYTPDFQEVVCTINEKPFLEPPKTIGSIFRLLPVKEIFRYYGTLFLHASQISYHGKGILFAAPSGVGKTTQAKLWRTYRNAEIICNDRVLIRKSDGVWRSHGYPIDGSEPVVSNQVNLLGGIVILQQGAENEAKRLTSGKAISLLMRQVVIDAWSSEARNQVLDRLAELVTDVPVFLLSCTPDEGAVIELEKNLKEKGGIKWEA